LNTLAVGRLLLEPQVAAHAREMFQVLSDPAIYEFENEPPQSPEWLESRFRRLESRRSSDGAELWLNWVIRLPSGALAGYVQATVLPESAAYVAYELASTHWRKGIGSSAVRAMLGELRVSYRVQICLAVFKAKNFRSVGLLRCLGFTPAAPHGLRPVICEPDEQVMYKPFAQHKNAV
jgi:RimJ/RimL family protein N-acetyltransferase